MMILTAKLVEKTDNDKKIFVERTFNCVTIKKCIPLAANNFKKIAIK